MLTEGFQDVRPPVEYPQFPYYSILIILVIFFIIFILVQFYKKLNKKLKVVNVPSWDRALLKLKDLEKSPWLAQGEYKLFYSALSDILRRYLEDRFNFKAAEMTTEEFLGYIHRTDFMTVYQKECLKEFMSCCDMIKFAKSSSSQEHALKSLVLIKQLVEDTQIKTKEKV